MQSVPVHHLVSTAWDEQRQQFNLVLAEDKLTELIARAQQKYGAEFTQSTKIHTITIYGSEAKCGKAFAMNSAGTASISQLSAADESLFNFGFEAMCYENGNATRYGLYASEPFKRYGQWYMALISQSSNSDVCSQLAD